MALVSPAKLSDEEKLEILQRLDRFRQWHFLDEKRYCLVCGEIITGRIKIAMVEAERHRLCLINRAGRAMRSLRKKTTSNTIGKTRPKPPLW